MLQRLIKSPVMASAAMLVFSALLFSFANKMGGDSFQVFINKKLAIQQYVTMKEPVKTLQLDQSNYNDEIEVYYSHCGQTGTGRSIAIRDAQNKLLKEWRFLDSPGVKSSMNCSVKDVAGLQKAGSGTLHLFYTSRELPEGKLLASIAVANAARATR